MKAYGNSPPPANTEQDMHATIEDHQDPDNLVGLLVQRRKQMRKDTGCVEREERQRK